MDERDNARPRIGMEVVDSNDHIVGVVEAVEHDHFVISRGFFFDQSQRIPLTAVDDIRGSELRLRITREAALHSSVDTHWASVPEHGEIVVSPPPENVPAE